MDRFRSEFIVRANLGVVRAFHSTTDALPALTPPPLRVQIHHGGVVTEGFVAKFSLTLGPARLNWHAIHENVTDYGFVDRQLVGPLTSWRHEHRFTECRAGTRVTDTIDILHPPGPRGWLTRAAFGHLSLTLLFRYRATQTRRHCER